MSAVKGKDKSHAILGGSVAEKWLECDGYEKAVKDLPDSPPNDATVKGDSEHHLIEVCAKTGVTPASYIGKPWIDVPEKWARKVYDRDQIDACEVWMDWIDENVNVMDGDSLHIEEEVELSSIASDLFGTSDGIILAPKRKLLIVADYKGGAGKDVDPVELPQGKFYTVGAADRFKTKHPDIDEWAVLIAIVQPRSGGVKTWDAPSGSIGEWRGEMRAAYKRQKRPEGTRKAGSHCHWCRAAGACSTLAEQSRLAVRKDFAVCVNGEEKPVISRLSAQQVGNILLVSPKVKAWLDDVEETARTTILSGGTIPGFRVVEGRKGARFWNDEEKAEKILDTILGEDAYERKLLSPAKAEKILKKDGIGAISSLISQPPGNPTLARAESTKEDFNNFARAIADFTT